jgi:hypothetical protein
MKTTLKVFLSIALFSSIALADGNQGSGGCPGVQTTKSPSVMTVVVSVVKQYLGLGY